MSIWCSGSVIGHDVDADAEGEQRGEVWSYATGWSNHYPDRKVEQPSTICVATIPVWCVPGHWDEEEFETVGEWLRLDVHTAEHDYKSGGQPTSRYNFESVVLDEEAARSLAADLLAWADRPKAKAIAPVSSHSRGKTT